MRWLFLILLFVLTSCKAKADFYSLLTAGPEIYQFNRVRDGGTFQNGRIDGFKVSLDRIKPYGWYVGGEYLYANGNLKGETATGRVMKSRLTDQIAEVRLGFTLQHARKAPFITPFGGWGYFLEENNFHPPSPLPCTFTDTFNYAVVGFLSGINFTPSFNLGVNFKLRFMQNAQSKVTNDPVLDNVVLLIKEEIHVRLDIPLLFTPCNTFLGMGFLISPFYEFRHFGGREGFPFDFRDTKFYLYGARFALTYFF